MQAELNGLVVSRVHVSVCRRQEGRLRAYASVVLNGWFKVTDIRVVEIDSGRVIAAMPSIRQANGYYKDVVHPIDEESRKWLEGVVLSEYVRECGRLAILDAAVPIEPFSTELREAV
jgi:stage V sporulation protein G